MSLATDQAALDRIAGLLEQLVELNRPKTTTFSGDVVFWDPEEASARLRAIEGDLDASSRRDPDDIVSDLQPTSPASGEGLAESVGGLQQLSVVVEKEAVLPGRGDDLQSSHDSSPSAGSGTGSVGVGDGGRQ